MKKSLILIAILAIVVTMFAQQPPARIKIGPKAEDPSMLLIYYATTPDLQCHFVTKSDQLLGPERTKLFGNNNKMVYQIVSIDEAILYVDKQWTYVFVGGEDAQGLYSEIPLEKLANGPHDLNWKLNITYQKEPGGKLYKEEAYSLVNWSIYSILKDVKGTRDPGKDHFEFYLNKAKNSEEMVGTVKY